MRQILFHIPFVGLPLFGYGVMLFLAFVGSMNLAAWRARREKLDPEVIYDLALWVFVGGLIGARVFYLVQHWGDKVRNFWDLFKLWEGGIVFYGSVIGGTLAFFLYWWRRRFPLRPMLDVVAPSIALGVALGRIGCFLNGCCYGDVCDLPWAVSFPPGSPAWWSQGAQIPGVDAEMLALARVGQLPPGAPWSLRVHPTQLYSAFDGFVLLGLLSAFYPLRRRDGEVVGLLMLTYPISRFLIEHLRNDEGAIFAGLTISQNVSVLIFAAGLVYWAWLSRQPRVRHADS